MICRYCGTANIDVAKFCYGCGKPLSTQKVQREAEPDYQVESAESVCPSCGRQLRKGVNFCGFCGTSIGLPADNSQNDSGNSQYVAKDNESEYEDVHIPIEELRTIKRFLDDGIITREEFDTIKKRLLKLE